MHWCFPLNDCPICLHVVLFLKKDHHHSTQAIGRSGERSGLHVNSAWTFPQLQKCPHPLWSYRTPLVSYCSLASGEHSSCHQLQKQHWVPVWQHSQSWHTASCGGETGTVASIGLPEKNKIKWFPIHALFLSKTKKMACYYCETTTNIYCKKIKSGLLQLFFSALLLL